MAKTVKILERKPVLDCLMNEYGERVPADVTPENRERVELLLFAIVETVQRNEATRWERLRRAHEAHTGVTHKYLEVLWCFLSATTVWTDPPFVVQTLTRSLSAVDKRYSAVDGEWLLALLGQLRVGARGRGNIGLPRIAAETTLRAGALGARCSSSPMPAEIKALTKCFVRAWRDHSPTPIEDVALRLKECIGSPSARATAIQPPHPGARRKDR